MKRAAAETLSPPAEPTVGTTAFRPGSLIHQHGEGNEISPGADGIERAGVPAAAGGGDITVAAVQSAVADLIDNRAERMRKFREKDKEVDRRIGALLEALRHKLGAGLKNLAGDGGPALSSLSDLLNGGRRWTPDILRPVMARLAALERDQQQQRKARP